MLNVRTHCARETRELIIAKRYGPFRNKARYNTIIILYREEAMPFELLFI